MLLNNNNILMGADNKLKPLLGTAFPCALFSPLSEMNGPPLLPCPCWVSCWLWCASYRLLQLKDMEEARSPPAVSWERIKGLLLIRRWTTSVWSLFFLYAHIFSCANHRQPELVCGLNPAHRALSSHGKTRWASQTQRLVGASSGMGHPAGSGNFPHCPPFLVGFLFKDTTWVGRVGLSRIGADRDGLGCSSKTHLLHLVPSSDLWYVFVMRKYLPAQLIFSTKFTSDWMLLRVTWGAMVKRKDGVDWERNTEHGKPLTILANLFSGLKCPHRALLCIQQINMALMQSLFSWSNSKKPTVIRHFIFVCCCSAQ